MMPQRTNQLPQQRGMVGILLIHGSSRQELKCPQGHALQRCAMPSQDGSCDDCQNPVRQWQMMMSCRKCNYDICIACYNKAAAAAAGVQVLRIPPKGSVGLHLNRLAAAQASQQPENDPQEDDAATREAKLKAAKQAALAAAKQAALEETNLMQQRQQNLQQQRQQVQAQLASQG